MPHFVKPRQSAIGPAGHTPLDMDRRSRLPADAFRPIPRPNDRWARMAREGDVTLVEAEVLAAGWAVPKGAATDESGIIVDAQGKRWIREEEIEGYEAPLSAPQAPLSAPQAAPSSDRSSERSVTAAAKVE